MAHVQSLFLLVIALAMATPAAAQWLKLPTPGIPRLADGKPNLGAPATAWWPAAFNFAITVRPIRPVPPATRIFMFGILPISDAESVTAQ